MAPEFYKVPRIYNQSVDIFAFGILIYELFSEKRPYYFIDEEIDELEVFYFNFIY